MIAFPAMAQVEDRARALAADFRMFLAKPLPAQDVVTAVKAVLRAPGGAKPAGSQVM